MNSGLRRSENVVRLDKIARAGFFARNPCSRDRNSNIVILDYYISRETRADGAVTNRRDLQNRLSNSLLRTSWCPFSVRLRFFDGS